MRLDICSLEDSYKKCLSSGNVKEKNEVDIELIKSIKNVSERGLSFIKNKSRNIPKESADWTFVFRDYYESLRGLIEAFLLFDKIEADSHQCKNAYLCFKNPDLELDWNFLETVRLKRNAINYRGQLLRFEDWNKLKLNFELHINILSELIKKRLKEF